MDQTTGLAADGRSLDRLKLQAGRNPAQAARAAASQFEALFMQSLLRGLRDTIPKSGLTSGSSSSETYTSMLDQQLTQKMAGRPGGLGEVIARQLSRQYTPNLASGALNGSLLQGSGGATATATTSASASATAAASSGALALVMPRRHGVTGESIAGTGAGRVIEVSMKAAAALSAPAVQGQAATAVADARAAATSVAANLGRIGRPDAQRAIDMVRANPKNASPAVRAAAAAASGYGQAAGSTAAMAAASRPRAGAATSRQADFVNSMWPHAVAAQRRTGTPAHLVIGQAALESGWGQRQIKLADGSPSHNLFGIKAGRNWTGKTVETVTTEFVDGRPMQMRQRFRAYDSYADAFADWSRLMNRSPRYEGLTRVRHDPGAYARQMQASGYATDPAYADKLEKTIRQTLALRQPVI